MKLSCNVVVEYETAKKADMALKSIKVDNYDFVKSKAVGKRLEATINSNSVSSLIHTLDDYLACVSVVEKIVNKS